MTDRDTPASRGSSTAPDQDDWRQIRSASMFASLGDKDFHLIVGKPRCETYLEGQTLFFENEPACAFFIVLKGWIVLSRDTSDGLRTVIKIVGPGESFAEALIASDARYPVSAEAASFLRVARFETAKVRTLLSTNPGLGLSIVAATFRQMQRLVDQIEHLKSWSIERRVAGMLLQMGGGEGAYSFTLPVEQHLIAARLAITPPTLSRTLKKLAALGVEAHRGHITIRDPNLLAAFVNDQST